MSPEKFSQEEVPIMLKTLEPDTKPLWGILTAQHMVEHIVGSWRISNGKAEVECKTPEEKLKKYRKFLFSEKPYKRNMKNPIMPDELFQLRKPDLNSAITQLKGEIEDFFTYHEANPDTSPVHPIFNVLNKDEWLIFQKKHIGHHFGQFALMDLSK